MAETKKCRECKEEIPADAKKCSKCGAKQGNWAVRHPIWTAVIVFFILCGIAGAGGSDNETTTSERTKSYTSRTTANKTDETNETTDNREETSSPRSTRKFSTEEREYASKMNNIMSTLSGNLQALQDVMNNHPEQILNTDEPDHFTSLIYMGVIQTQYKQAQEITPPVGYEEVHELFLESLQGYSDAMNLITAAVDGKNDQGIVEAQAKVKEADEIASQAATKLEEVNSQK